MESKFKTNLIILSKTGSKLGCLFALIILLPGTIGIMLRNEILIVIGFVGMFLMFVVQIITRNKYSSTSNIREFEFVEFDLTSLTIHDGPKPKHFYWSDMKDIIIRIHDFKGEVSIASADMTNTNHGTLNYISFKMKSVQHRYHFFLKNSAEKELIINIVEKDLKHMLESSGKLKAIYIRKTDTFYNK